jgi:2-dehydropantoate 2-reductase
MRIAVFGAGAVGCYFGARLAEAGEEVVFIARGVTLAALQGQGIRVTSDLGDLELAEVVATDDPSSVGEVDAVLLAVKSWQVAEAGEAMKPMIGPKTCILPLQNGVEAPGRLDEVLGAGHALGGTVWVIANADEPGQVRQVGGEARIVLGELDNRRSDRLRSLAAALERARARVIIPDNVRQAMWEKLLFISVVSGLGAVTRVPVGVWRDLRQSRALAEEAAQEIVAVAAAEGVVLSTTAALEALRIVDIMPADATASMQRDIMAGRPSELEAQNGSIVRLGHARAVLTPVNRFLYASLLPQEQEARRKEF